MSGLRKKKLLQIYQEMTACWLRVLWVLTVSGKRRQKNAKDCVWKFFFLVIYGQAQNQRPANFDYRVNVDITPTPKYFFNPDSASPSPFVNPTTPVFNPLTDQEDFDERSRFSPYEERPFRPQFRGPQRPYPSGRTLFNPTDVPYTENYLDNG